MVWYVSLVVEKFSTIVCYDTFSLLLWDSYHIHVSGCWLLFHSPEMNGSILSPSLSLGSRLVDFCQPIFGFTDTYLNCVESTNDSFICWRLPSFPSFLIFISKIPILLFVMTPPTLWNPLYVPLYCLRCPVFNTLIVAVLCSFSGSRMYLDFWLALSLVDAFSLGFLCAPSFLTEC